MNLLFISIDDLRPLLNCYGHSQMHTPNLDALAARGVRFDKNFCQYPVCGASRASLMTGIRPKADRFTNYFSRADEDAPSVPTLLHHLKDHGYQLHGNRKILHDENDHAHLWDSFHESKLPHFPAPYYSADSIRAIEENSQPKKDGEASWMKGGPAFDCADVPDNAYIDGDSVEHAIETLSRLAKSDKPFMYAYGSINVHLPFKAPKQYWDLYDRDAIDVNPHHADYPNDVPARDLHNWGELRNYIGIPKEGPLDDDLARTLTHGYMAGVSYLDAQIGKLLQALDDNGLRDNTAIVFWVDHGFNLGEHGLWCKHCVYETSLHVPLMMVMPDRSDIAGTVVDRVVENLDLFPTVCDILGLPKPEHLQGRSLMPLIEDPGCEWDAYAYSRNGQSDSIRTDEYRYSEWLDADGNVSDRVLFDHRENDREEENLAERSEYKELIAELSSRFVNIRNCD